MATKPTPFVASRERASDTIARKLEKVTDDLHLDNTMLKDLPKQISRLNKTIQASEDMAKHTISHQAASIRLKNLQRQRNLRVTEALLKDLPAKRDQHHKEMLKLKEQWEEELKKENKEREARAAKNNTSLSQAPPPPSVARAATVAPPPPSAAPRGMFGDHSKYIDPSKPKPVAHVEHRAPLQALKPNNGARAADQAGQKRKAGFDGGEDTMPTTRAQKKRKTEESMAKPASRLSRKPKKVVPPRALFSPSPPPETPEKTAASASASKKRKATDEPAEPVGRVSKKTKTAEVTSAPISPSPQPADSEKKDDGADDAAASAASPARQSATGEPDLATTTADHSSKNADEGLDGAAASTASPESAPTTDEAAVATTTPLTSSENAGDSGSSTPISDSSAVNKKKKATSQYIGRDKIDLNSKSVARAVKKKTGSKAKEGKDSVAGGRVSKPEFKPKRVSLNGIINPSNACFSGVTLQVIDTALEGPIADQVLGEVDDDLEMYGLSEKELRSFDNTRDVVSAKLLKKKNAMKAGIKAAVKAGETEKVSVAKHLHLVLEDLRHEYPKADKHVVGLAFNMVVAFSGAGDVDRAEGDLSDRQQMSGDTQQDAFMFFQTVYNALLDELDTASANKLRELFEVHTETQEVCLNDDCDYESDTRAAISNYHNINVPANTNGEVELGDLFKASKLSTRDAACPTCGHNGLKAVTQFAKLPDNLVVKMNRTAFNTTTGEASKIETFVNLQRRTFVLKGEKFELSVVVRHHGSTVDRGHYTAFRKFDGNWHLLDDKNCDKKTVEDVKDSTRHGKCAMLLLQRVKA